MQADALPGQVRTVRCSTARRVLVWATPDKDEAAAEVPVGARALVVGAAPGRVDRARPMVLVLVAGRQGWISDRLLERA